VKVAESKSSATAPLLQKKNAEQQSPFFQPEHAGSALDSSQSAFFSPKGSSSIQRKPFFIQPKLTIGQPGDQYEQEADRMADQVVQRLAENNNAAAAPPTPVSPGIQRKCADCEKEEQLQQKEEPGEEEQLRMKPIFESAAPPPDDDTVQRKCAACEEEEKVQHQEMEEEEPLQTKSLMRKSAEGRGGYTASPQLTSQLNSSKSGGSPLPDGTRIDMEGAIGSDFSSVRVHTDNSAAQMNKELGAQAFTHGSDVYFGTGKYDTGSTEGQRLLGHELTHVVQQGSAATNYGVIQRSNGDKAKDSVLSPFDVTWGGDAFNISINREEKSGTHYIVFNIKYQGSNSLAIIGSETGSRIVETSIGSAPLNPKILGITKSALEIDLYGDRSLVVKLVDKFGFRPEPLSGDKAREHGFVLYAN
jgi:hypothetical protein